jgi:sulfotransferase famil protein
LVKKPASFLLSSWKTRRRHRRRAASSYSYARKKIFEVLLGGIYDLAEYFVSDEMKLVYVVNSKAGCTSIKKSILEAHGYNVGVDHYSEIHQKGNKFGLTKNKIDSRHLDYFFFSFVRNPFYRMASLYFNKFCDQRRICEHGFEYRRYLGGILERDDSFSTFARKISEIPDELSDRHFKSQYTLLYKEAPRIDMVSKLENIVEVYPKLEKKFGLKKIEVVNKSAAYRLIDFYDEASFNLVASRYEADIETFGYQEEYDDLKRAILSGSTK